MPKAYRNNPHAEDENVVEYVKESYPCVGTQAVATKFDISRQAANNKLNRLYEEDKIDRKQIGRSYVWYKSIHELGCVCYEPEGVYITAPDYMKDNEIIVAIFVMYCVKYYIYVRDMLSGFKNRSLSMIKYK